MNVKIPLTSRT